MLHLPFCRLSIVCGQFANGPRGDHQANAFLPIWPLPSCLSLEMALALVMEWARLLKTTGCCPIFLTVP